MRKNTALCEQQYSCDPHSVTPTSLRKEVDAVETVTISVKRQNL